MFVHALDIKRTKSFFLWRKMNQLLKMIYHALKKHDKSLDILC